MDPTGERSKNIFILPNGDAVKATGKLKLQQKIRTVALEMNVTPGVHTSLINVCQMLDAGYVTVFDENECNIYDRKKVKNCHIRKSSFERILVQKFGILENYTKGHNFERKYGHNNNRSAKSGRRNNAHF